MRPDTQCAEPNWKPIDYEKERLYANDAIDEPVEQFLREDGMLFHEFRKVVQAGSYVALAP